MRVPVKLLHRYGPALAGETAGFAEDVANQLVERGIAKRLDPAPESAPTAAGAQAPKVIAEPKKK
jgi:hypothetical protein